MDEEEFKAEPAQAEAIESDNKRPWWKFWADPAFKTPKDMKMK